MNEFKQAAHDVTAFLGEAIHAGNILAAALYDLQSSLAFYAGDGAADANGAAAADADASRDATPAGDTNGGGRAGLPAKPAPAECDGIEPSAQPGGAGAPVQTAMVYGLDEHPDGECSERQIAPKEPLREHLRQDRAWRYDRLPNALDAAAVLAGREAVVTSRFIAEFDDHCREHHLAAVKRIGARYLAHCNGYVNGRIAGRAALVRK